MNFCFNSRPAIQRFFLGVSTGAVATIVIGFASGGWILGTTARRLVEKSSSSAVVAALAPICVDQFQQALTAATNLVELRKNLQPAAFVQKGGWSSMPGGKTADEPAVAGACAALLMAQAPEEELGLEDRQNGRAHWNSFPSGRY
jgi:hypothetical protein